MGKVTKIRDYIVEVAGLTGSMINELVEFKNGVQGIIVKATEKNAEIALFDQEIDNPLQVGDEVKGTGKEFSTKVNEKALGNIINVEGEILTTYETPEEFIKSKEEEIKPIFRTARPIYSRDFVNEPLITGIAAVDWAIPIGKGQRELILGDRKTGKTAMAINAILAQKDSSTKIIYVAVGQKRTSILDVYQKIEKANMLNQVVIVAASADQTATKKWLAPYTGVTYAEYFQEKYGDDVLIIYDDLSKHADAYRELSLLMKSAPAREAYPGDIFYLHSKLLERAGKFAITFGGGSITALPVIQTEAGDITSYIPTNVISITDGQIFTSKALFNEGHRPAVDIPYSVSRVGSTAQTKALAQVAGGLKLLVSQYEEAKKITRLAGEVSPENESIIDRGRVLMALLVQPEGDVLDYNTGILLLSLFKRDYLNFFTKTKEITFIKELLNKFMINDFLGQQIGAMIASQKVEKEQFHLMLTEVILPMIKYHIIKKHPHLRQEEKFIDLYTNIRDDSRVYENIKKTMIEGV